MKMETLTKGELYSRVAELEAQLVKVREGVMSKETPFISKFGRMEMLHILDEAEGLPPRTYNWDFSIDTSETPAESFTPAKIEKAMISAIRKLCEVEE